MLEDREAHDAGRYRFKHLLMRDVAYAALPKAERADLHEVFARELERAVGDRRDEYAEIVAFHVARAFTLSAEVRAPRAVLEPRARSALDRALVLGERARRRQDVGLLRAYASTAKEALDALGDAARPEDRVGSTLLTADERRFATEYAAARDGYEAAARLAAAIARPDLGARAHLGAAQTAMWTVSTRGDIELFVGHVADAERLFGEAGDDGGAIEAGIIALEELWQRGEVDALLERGRALRARAQSIGDGVRELQISSRLFPACIVGGRPDEASEYAARTDALVAELGARRPPWSRVGKCAILRTAGDLEAALTCYAEFEEIARVEQDPLFLLSFYRNMAELFAIEQRRYAEAWTLAERGVELSVRLGEWWNRVELKATLAVASAGIGDLAAANELLRDAKDGSGDVFAAAYSTYCRARVHETAGSLDEADASYRAAEDAFASTGFRKIFWHGLIHLDHAELLVRRGSGQEAAAHAATAESILGQQKGERAARIGRIRLSLATASSR